MAPKATTQNQATKEAAMPATSKMQYSPEAPGESRSHCCSGGVQERSIPPQCTPARRASCPHPPTARRLDAKHAGLCSSCQEEANTSRTVASQERNRSVSLSSGFILCSFSKSHASTSSWLNLKYIKKKKKPWLQDIQTNVAFSLPNSTEQWGPQAEATVDGRTASC